MDRESKIVCGLTLIEMDTNGQCAAENAVKMGVVTLPNTDITLVELRNEIRNQYPCDELKRYSLIMDNYAFVAENNFPITTIQESDFTAKDVLREDNVIAIQRRTENVEIRILKKDELIATLNSTYTTSLSEVRKELLTALQADETSNSLEFNFVHLNGSIIALSSEPTTCVYEVYDNETKGVKILIKDKNTNQKQIKSNKLRKSIRRLKFWKKKKQIANETHVCNEVESPTTLLRMTTEIEVQKIRLMISYATQDSTSYARRLCDELDSLGISVYLDKHEIKIGDNWPQSLNNAVIDCRVFVPIITRNYGNTFWTRREIETAVGLQNKLIIPIRFVDTYPPTNLTLLLFSTQAISGIDDGKNEGTKISEKNWKTEDVKRVAEEIKQRMDRMPNSDDTRIQIDPIEESTVTVVAHPRYSNNYSVLKEIFDEKFELKCNPIWVQNESNEMFKELNRALLKKKNEVKNVTKEVASKNIATELTASETAQKQSSETDLIKQLDSNLITNEGNDHSTTNPPEAASDNSVKESETSLENNTKTPTSDEKSSDEIDGKSTEDVSSDLKSNNDSNEHQEKQKLQLENCVAVTHSTSDDQENKEIDASNDCDESEQRSKKENQNQRRNKRKLDSSKYVLLLISKESFESEKFLEYIYYSSLKSNTIVVICEETDYPEWFLRSFPISEHMMFNDESFKSSLVERIKLLSDTNLEDKPTANSEELRTLVHPIVKSIPEKQTCIYIDNVLEDDENCKTLSHSIASELGKHENISLIINETNVFKETIARTFLESKTANKNLSQSKIIIVETNTNSATDDTEIEKQESNSAPETVFVGENDCERNEAIAACCDVCVLFVNNDCSAKQVNTYEYHEKYVVPLMLDESSQFPALNNTFEMLSTEFGVPKSELIIDSSNLDNVIQSTMKIVTEVVAIRFPKVEEIKGDSEKKSKDMCLIL